MSRAAVLSALSLAILAGAASAHAQEPSPADVDAARALFQSGIEASEAERWNEARVSFERSYALVPRASTLLNLAAAQTEVGALVEARESYLRFLEQARSGPAADFRDDAEGSLADVEARIARVSLTIEALQPDDALEVDGVSVRHEVLASPMPMNPGERRVVVRRDGQEVGRLELTLLEGEARGISMPLHASAIPEPTPEPISTSAEEPEENLLTSPWLWLGVGGGVLVLAAVILGVALAVGGEASLYSGNLGPGALRFD